MRLPFNEDAAKAAGFLAEQSSGIVRFLYEESSPKRGEAITASIDADGNLDLIVERSASHRELARKLGAVDGSTVEQIEKDIRDSFKSS